MLASNFLLSTGSTVVVIAAIVVLAALICVSTVYFIKGKKSTKVIEFQGDNNKLVQVIDVLTKNKQAQTLIVPPTHWGIAIKNGDMQLMKNPEYNIPTGSQIHSLKVLFISKTVKMIVNWGANQNQRFDYIEPRIGPVSVGAFGQMEISVSNPEQFYLTVVANFGSSFELENLRTRVLEITIDEVMETLGATIREYNMPYYEFVAAKRQIQTKIGANLRNKFSEEYGFTVYNFIIESINVPKEDEIKLKDIESYSKDRLISKRFENDIHEDNKDIYRKKRELVEDEDFFYEHDKKREREEIEYKLNMINKSEDRMRAHIKEDEDRAFAKESGMLDKEVNLITHVSDKYYETVKQAGWENSKKAEENTETDKKKAAVGRFCTMCGAGYSPQDKYCPSCGAVIDKPGSVKICPQCKQEVPIASNYCGKCNHKF